MTKPIEVSVSAGDMFVSLKLGHSTNLLTSREAQELLQQLSSLLVKPELTPSISHWGIHNG